MDLGATLTRLWDNSGELHGRLGRRIPMARRALGDLQATLMRETPAGRWLTARRQQRFIDDLRLLNDTLANTTLDDRYSVWGGLLIGWARQGSPLAHDCADADFAVRLEDLPDFERAARALVGAGFKPLYRFVNNGGRATEYSFARRGAKFEFFLLDRVGDQLRYYLYSPGTRTPYPMQAVACIPDLPMSRFRFLNRTWRKHADHDAVLRAIYGDWRNPAPDWWYMDDLAIVDRVRWERADETRWAGEFGDLRDQPKR